MKSPLDLLTPRHLLLAARVSAGACAFGLAVLMLGPFQGLEHAFGLSDKSAHVIAFFCVTQGLFLIAPRWRKADLAMAVILLAVASEFGQGLTGRSMSMGDGLADAAGVLVAMVPGWIERLRWMVRTHSDRSLADIGRTDRRKRRKRRVAAPAGPVSPSVTEH